MDEERVRCEADERARLAQIQYDELLKHGLGCCDVPSRVVAAIIIGTSIDRLAQVVDRLAAENKARRTVDVGLPPY